MKLFKVLLILVLCSLNVAAQTKMTYISKKSVTVGESFMVRYELSYPIRSNFKFQRPPLYFPAQRINNQSKLVESAFNEVEVLKFTDTTVFAGTQNIWYADFELVAWNEGYIELTGLPFELKGLKDRFSSLLVDVKLMPKREGVDIYDIYEFFPKVKRTFSLKDFFRQWGLLILLILLLVFLAFIWLKRKSKSKTTIEIKSLEFQTLESLDALHKRALWIEDEKRNATESAFILRWYLSARYNVSLLERTTLETYNLLQFKKINLSHLSQIHEILKKLDMIKFATAKLGPEEHESILKQLKQIVIETSPKEKVHV